MLRFIFVCMTVVGLCFVAMGTQYMSTGIEGAADDVFARNMEPQPATQDVAMDETSPEALNAIETTAGEPAFDPNDKFVGGFTDETPKALMDPVKKPAATPVQTAPEQAN